MTPVKEELEYQKSNRDMGSQSVIPPEINRLENWTSPALIIDEDENEEIEISRAAEVVREI